MNTPSRTSFPQPLGCWTDRTTNRVLSTTAPECELGDNDELQTAMSPAVSPRGKHAHIFAVEQRVVPTPVSTRFLLKVVLRYS